MRPRNNHHIYAHSVSIVPLIRKHDSTSISAIHQSICSHSPDVFAEREQKLPSPEEASSPIGEILRRQTTGQTDTLQFRPNDATFLRYVGVSFGFTGYRGKRQHGLARLGALLQQE